MNKFLLPLKLQLFADDISEEMVEVADQSIEETEDIQETSVEDEVADHQLEEPKLLTSRDFEKDTAYAKMRREAEQLKKQNELLAKTFEKFGFKGSPEEIADQANAHYQERPVEEVRAERLAKEQESNIEQELNYYKEQEVIRLMNEDLKKIQKLDPTVKTLETLDRRYFQFIQSGLDGESAFAALQQLQKKEQKKPPAEVGKINSSTNILKDYYSKEEVDKMSETDLDNPKIWQRVRNSMTKW